MALHVTLELPADVEERLRCESARLDADVKEAYALELFRRGTLTHAELLRTRARPCRDGRVSEAS